MFFTDTDYMMNNNCIPRSSPSSTTPSAENQGVLRINVFIHLFYGIILLLKYKIQ